MPASQLTSTLRLNDGHEIPALGFGLWRVAEAERVTEEALGVGYRLVDGAAVYGNEVEMGEGLRRSCVPRDEVFVTTKCWNDNHGFDAALRAFDASLARLGLHQLDLYLIHWPQPAKNLYVDTWRALIRLRDEGRVRSIGVSNFHAPHLERLIGETGVTPALNQIELNPRIQQAELRALHQRLGIVTQSWTPLGQGRSFDDPVITGIAARVGRSPAQVILRWHLELGLSVIPRSTRKAGLVENLALFDFSLTSEDHAAIATLDRGERTGPNPEQFT